MATPALAAAVGGEIANAELVVGPTPEIDDVRASFLEHVGTLAISAVGEASAATGINGNESDESAKSAGAVYVLVGL